MKKRKRYIIFLFSFLFSIIFCTSLFFYSKKNNTFRIKTKYINFKNEDIGLSGRIKTIEVNNINNSSNIHAFVMHAGAANSADYINIVKELNIKSATLIDHNNLDSGENLIMINFRKVLNQINKIYSLHDSLNYLKIVPESDLFWDMHDFYLSRTIDHYFTANNNLTNQNYIFIGHSHGASLKASNYINSYTSNNTYMIYINPCFRPDLIKEKIKSYILIISGEKDKEGCFYNLKENLDLITNEFQINMVKGLKHFSFLPNREPDLQHLVYYEYDPSHKNEVIRLINNFLNTEILKND